MRYLGRDVFGPIKSDQNMIRKCAPMLNTMFQPYLIVFEGSQKYPKWVLLGPFWDHLLDHLFKGAEIFDGAGTGFINFNHFVTK